jgi:DNA gyrase subunit A
MTPKQEDFVSSLFVASTHSHILFFTDKGKAYVLKVYDIPQAGRTARGKAIVNILKLSPEEQITTCMPVKEFAEDNFIVMATKSGIIKKTDLMSFSNIRSGGIIAVNLDKGDSLIATRLTDGSKSIFVGTRGGLAIRFNENQVREMGRTARGVKAIKLAKKDHVVSMLALDGNQSILTVTEKGYGKRTKVDQYREQLRGGQGIINLKITAKTGSVIGISRVSDSDEMMITTSDGKIIRIAMNDVSVIGRNTQGVRLMNVQKDVELTGIAKSAAPDEMENDSEDSEG